MSVSIILLLRELAIVWLFSVFSPIRTPFLWADFETGVNIVFIEAANKNKL